MRRVAGTKWKLNIANKLFLKVLFSFEPEPLNRIGGMTDGETNSFSISCSKLYTEASTLRVCTERRRNTSRIHFNLLENFKVNPFNNDNY